MNKFLITLTVILAAAVIILSYRSCVSKPVQTEQDNISRSERTTDSLNMAIDSILAAQNGLKNELLKKAIVWEYKYDSIVDQEKKVRGLINAREITIQGLLYQLDSLKKDTIATVIDCKELQSEVRQLLDLQDILEDNLDSANEKTKALLEVRDKIIGNLQDQLSEMWKKYSELEAQNKVLIEGDKKFVRKVKIADLTTKIATVAAAILSVITILKK